MKPTLDEHMAAVAGELRRRAKHSLFDGTTGWHTSATEDGRVIVSTVDPT